MRGPYTGPTAYSAVIRVDLGRLNESGTPQWPNLGPARRDIGSELTIQILRVGASYSSLSWWGVRVIQEFRAPDDGGRVPPMPARAHVFIELNSPGANSLSHFPGERPFIS